MQVLVVSAVSKVRNLKAIHNSFFMRAFCASVVSAVSKVRNLKAIHNIQESSRQADPVVSAVSKVRNLKAIHNRSWRLPRAGWLFLPYQR